MVGEHDPGALIDLIDASNTSSASLRIFYLNAYTPLGYVTSGTLGRLNSRSIKRRRKHAVPRLRSGRALTRIYTEGDSWFQHPLLSPQSRPLAGESFRAPHPCLEQRLVA